MEFQVLKRFEDLEKRVVALESDPRLKLPDLTKPATDATGPAHASEASAKS